MLKRTRNHEIAFIKHFYQSAEDYMVTFLEVEETKQRADNRFSSGRPTEKQFTEIIAKWSEQRERLSKILDGAIRISEKHNVQHNYAMLLRFKPGDVGEWGDKRLCSRA